MLRDRDGLRCRLTRGGLARLDVAVDELEGFFDGAHHDRADDIGVGRGTGRGVAELRAHRFGERAHLLELRGEVSALAGLALRVVERTLEVFERGVDGHGRRLHREAEHLLHASIGGGAIFTLAVFASATFGRLLLGSLEQKFVFALALFLATILLTLAILASEIGHLGAATFVRRSGFAVTLRGEFRGLDLSVRLKFRGFALRVGEHASVLLRCVGLGLRTFDRGLRLFAAALLGGALVFEARPLHGTEDRRERGASASDERQRFGERHLLRLLLDGGLRDGRRVGLRNPLPQRRAVVDAVRAVLVLAVQKKLVRALDLVGVRRRGLGQLPRGVRDEGVGIGLRNPVPGAHTRRSEGARNVRPIDQSKQTVHDRRLLLRGRGDARACRNGGRGFVVVARPHGLTRRAVFPLATFGRVETGRRARPDVAVRDHRRGQRRGRRRAVGAALRRAGEPLRCGTVAARSAAERVVRTARVVGETIVHRVTITTATAASVAAIVATGIARLVGLPHAILLFCGLRVDVLAVEIVTILDVFFERLGEFPAVLRRVDLPRAGGALFETDRERAPRDDLLKPLRARVEPDELQFVAVVVVVVRRPPRVHERLACGVDVVELRLHRVDVALPPHAQPDLEQFERVAAGVVVGLELREGPVLARAVLFEFLRGPLVVRRRLLLVLVGDGDFVVWN